MGMIMPSQKRFGKKMKLCVSEAMFARLQKLAKKEETTIAEIVRATLKREVGAEL
ncbi:MAG: hypothetical protein HY394_02520 [Candidatus Diapherotrites archaeon]|nr:hypothetical protein [Candidatus Diapherotrites archaeon]